MYKVTLAMPVYNVGRYIERALLSALNQTFDNIEYILVDDKGADNSMSIAWRIISTHPRGKDVRIIDHGVNQGPGATRNSVIKEAQGKYLFFMDSDDEITPDCIEVLYNKMQETPVSFVAGSIDEVDDNGTVLLHRQYKDRHLTSNDEILCFQYNPALAKAGETTPLIAPVWNKLYRLDFLKKSKIRCIPYQKNEDLIFSFQLFLTADSCRIVSVATYKYNVAREGSTTVEARKGYTDFRLRQDIDIVEFYASYIDSMRKRSRDISKFVFATIVTKACVTIYRLNSLNIIDEEKNKIRKLLKRTVDIRLNEMPKTQSGIFFWAYLHAPNYLRKLMDRIYFKRRKIY